MSKRQFRAALLVALGQQLRNLLRLWELAQLVDQLLRALLGDDAAEVLSIRAVLETLSVSAHSPIPSLT